MQKLAEQFVPAADEVWHLQNGRDEESRFFQVIAEQGHYGGRTVPTNTRQGTYAITPSGKFLASINSNDPEAMHGMMQRALDAWKGMSRDERLGVDAAKLAEEAQRVRWERLFPDGGLVLRVTSRDLPRQPEIEGRWANAWNMDYAWFRKDEVARMVPAQPKIGDKHSLPSDLVQRLVRLNFLDNVRGQTHPVNQAGIEKAELTATVTAVKGKTVEMKLEGVARQDEAGRWAIRDRHDANNPQQQRRGMALSMLGYATFDTSKGQFVKLDLIAAGDRWGATQYNGRHNDLGPAPIAFYVAAVPGENSTRVPPAHLGAYGW